MLTCFRASEREIIVMSKYRQQFPTLSIVQRIIFYFLIPNKNKETLLMPHGLPKDELPKECGIFKHRVYVGNMRCVYSKPFVLSCHLHHTFTCWCLDGKCYFALWASFRGEFSNRGQSRHLSEGKPEESGLLIWSTKTFPSVWPITSNLGKILLTNFSYFVNKIGFYSLFWMVQVS